MRRRFGNRAILVLESPWEMDDTDANRTSVLPFIEGLAKMAGDTDVHYANFYDGNSFAKALECLCKGERRSRIVYIAAHGYRDQIADASMRDLLFQVAKQSKKHRIDGVLMGSCFVGENSATMETYLEGSRLRWCIGYNSATYWLDGTLIDCRLLAILSRLQDKHFKDRELPIKAMAKALSLFNPEVVIGSDYHEKNVTLKEGMSFVLQLRGKGNRARTITDAVWDELRKQGKQSRNGADEVLEELGV